MQTKNFWHDNKVLILGLVSAVSIALYQFVGTEVTDWTVVGYAGAIAVGSYLSRNLRGQWATIAGFIGTAATTIYTAHKTGGDVDMNQLIFQALVAFGLAVAPPPKPLAYEQTPTMEIAKAEAVEIQELQKEQKNADTPTSTTTVPATVVT